MIAGFLNPLRLSARHGRVSLRGWRARCAAAVSSLATGLALVLAFAPTLPAAAQFQLGDHTPGLKNEIPAPIKGMEIENKLGDRVPLDLPLIDASGRKVTLGEYFNRPARDKTGAALGANKPIVLVMVYFRCKLLCPMVLEKFTATLKDVDFTAGREYDAVVVSFDHRDSATDAASQQNAQVLTYGRGTDEDVRSGWHFLVGEPENTRRLGQALGFPFRFLQESGEYSHATAVYILTPDGRIARALTGLNYPAKDVRLALLEASEGRIGSAFDKFTFWCFHFDPSAGTYSVRVMRVMQAAGAAGVVVLGSLIGAYLWRERRRRFRPTSDGTGQCGVSGIGIRAGLSANALLAQGDVK